MISTFIAEHQTLMAFLVGAVLVVCVVLAAVFARGGDTGRRVAGVLATLGLLAIVGLTLVPDTAQPADVRCNLDPIYFLRDHENMLLFLVPALFAVVALRRPLLVLAAGIGLSLAIEAVQAAIPAVGRRCDVDDWLANGIGTLVGVAVAAALVAVLDRRRRPVTSR
ncbi:VanZ family protein [Aeromicrobium massiliense]|uniref:VanZ family protein n=1 Tax=Aeromicrobium massiliense TaxID=1464554 RepID=UPI0002EBE46B|nr:VanZ family protein [Aeromicrobium massiliense]